MKTDINRAQDKLKELEERSKIAKAHITKYTKMTYAQVLQEPENIDRLERDEISQSQTFELLIKHKHKQLHPRWEELFSDYYKLFLRNKCPNINHYLNNYIKAKPTSPQLTAQASSPKPRKLDSPPEHRKARSHKGSPEGSPPTNPKTK